MRPAAVAVVALILAGLTGCGTVQNFARPEDGSGRPLEVYGGVSRSGDALKEKATVPDLVVVSYAPFYVPDVVLSAVGDTVTLPLTTAVTAYRLVRAMEALRVAEPSHERLWREFWSNDPPATQPSQQPPRR